MATPIPLKPTALPIGIPGGVVTQKPLVQKPRLNVPKLAVYNAQDSGTYIHPDLTPTHIPGRGRALCMSNAISAGTVILADAPYALVPARCSDDEQSKEGVLVCSNLSCCRKIPRDRAILCPRGCFEDVIWCDCGCRDADRLRHEYECAWLKHEGTVIRGKETPYDFATLWLIVRLLAGRHIEASAKRDRYPWEDTFQCGWASVESCCGTPETWPDELQHWRRLIAEYFCNLALLPNMPSQAEILALLCKEESNGFGLYSATTGEYPVPEPATTRGRAHGTALYTRAALTNHSCHPNVTRRSDSKGRMVFTTSRAIAAGEEVCISYVDLVEFPDTASRKKALKDWFAFDCDCDRCA